MTFLFVLIGVIMLTLIWIFGRMLIYAWASKGFLSALVPSNSFLPVEVGRNIVRGYVTPPDKSHQKYFESLKAKGNDNSPYQIIPPGKSGFVWLGLPGVVTIPEWADTEDLLRVTEETYHAMRLHERVLIYDFEPDPERLKEINKIVDNARKTGRRNVSPEIVRALQYMPNQKTRDMIDVRVRLAVYLRTIDPLLSFTEIRFPQDMIRGKIVQVLRQVMTGLDFYRSTVSSRKVGSSARLRSQLITRMQNDLRLELGINPGIEEFLDPDGNLIEASLPDKNKVARQILDEWGYLIRDVLVEDVQEVSDTITKALAAVTEEQAKATATQVKAEAKKRADIIESEGTAQARVNVAEAEKKRLQLEGEGTQQALAAQISAFTGDSKVSAEGVEQFQLWFSREILGRNVAESGRTILYQWPNLPPGQQPLEPVYNAIKALVASQPELLQDPAKLGELVRGIISGQASPK